ncbi:hypothetical protein [Haloechinothrix aidingensis]
MGGKLATSRALSGPAHRLTDRTSEDIESVPHEHGHLVR